VNLQYWDLSHFVSFDQYQRYLLIRRVVQALFPGKTRILEVGAAYSPLRELLPDHNVVLLDETTGAPNLDLRAGGLHLPFRDHAFPVVVSTDVLEHMPAEKRPEFLRELIRVASATLILGFPHNAQLSIMAERVLNDFVQQVTGKNYRFLDEHLKYGLPDAREIHSLVQALMPEIVEVKNANIYSWLPLMMADFAIQDFPESNGPRIMISEFFRWYHEPGSHDDPTYRTFFICSRTSFSPDQRQTLLNTRSGSPGAAVHEFASSTLALAMSFRQALLELKGK
jgi:hypothetical protein